MSDSDSEYDFDYGFGSDRREAAPDEISDGDGMACEVMQYERLTNANGEQVLLRAGTKKVTLSNRNPDSAHSALVVTAIWNRDRTSFDKELQIQSPHMKMALKTCVPEYKNFDTQIRNIRIVGDPRCVFHFHLELMSYRDRCNRSGDVQAGQPVQYLIDYAFGLFMAEVRMFHHFVQESDLPSLDFESLWMAFVPGEFVYVSRTTPRTTSDLGTAFRLETMRRRTIPNRSDTWVIVGWSIDFDGRKYGHIRIEVEIEYYSGVSVLEDLVAMPLKYHRRAGPIREQLHERAKIFINLHGQHHMQFHGVAELLKSKRDLTYHGEVDHFAPRSIPVNGRIVIDGALFSEWRLTHQPFLRSSQRKFDTELFEHKTMTDEELIICMHSVRGFSLNENLWGSFPVESLAEAAFDQSFEGLILDQGYKDMILALVNIHTDERLGFDDIVKGKGKGMVFLLHGDPGLGKTLTVESVADKVERPLIRLDAGSLGGTVEEIERSLTETFTLATKWSAIILIDEADVFLEERKISDMNRNRIVSVFLRTLEYYEGILFLATNRIGTFDPAFKSRIHLAVQCPHLNAAKRYRIWTLFLQRIADRSAEALLNDRKALERLSQEPLNRRQIKNVARTAHSIAVSEDRKISEGDVDIALRAMRKFDADFHDATARVTRSREDGEDDDLDEARASKSMRVEDPILG